MVVAARLESEAARALKEQANGLFREGKHQEACTKYKEAVEILLRDCDGLPRVLLQSIADTTGKASTAPGASFFFSGAVLAFPVANANTQAYQQAATAAAEAGNCSAGIWPLCHLVSTNTKHAQQPEQAPQEVAHVLSVYGKFEPGVVKQILSGRVSAARRESGLGDFVEELLKVAPDVARWVRNKNSVPGT